MGRHGRGGDEPRWDRLTVGRVAREGGARSVLRVATNVAAADAHRPGVVRADGGGPRPVDLGEVAAGFDVAADAAQVEALVLGLVSEARRAAPGDDAPRLRMATTIGPDGAIETTVSAADAAPSVLVRMTGCAGLHGDALGERPRAYDARCRASLASDAAALVVASWRGILARLSRDWDVEVASWPAAVDAEGRPVDDEDLPVGLRVVDRATLDREEAERARAAAEVVSSRLWAATDLRGLGRALLGTLGERSGEGARDALALAGVDLGDGRDPALVVAAALVRALDRLDPPWRGDGHRAARGDSASGVPRVRRRRRRESVPDGVGSMVPGDGVPDDDATSTWVDEVGTTAPGREGAPDPTPAPVDVEGGPEPEVVAGGEREPGGSGAADLAPDREVDAGAGVDAAVPEEGAPDASTVGVGAEVGVDPDGVVAGPRPSPEADGMGDEPPTAPRPPDAAPVDADETRAIEPLAPPSPTDGREGAGWAGIPDDPAPAASDETEPAGIAFDEAVGDVAEVTAAEDPPAAPSDGGHAVVVPREPTPDETPEPDVAPERDDASPPATGVTEEAREAAVAASPTPDSSDGVSPASGGDVPEPRFEAASDDLGTTEVAGPETGGDVPTVASAAEPVDDGGPPPPATADDATGGGAEATAEAAAEGDEVAILDLPALPSRPGRGRHAEAGRPEAAPRHRPRPHPALYDGLRRHPATGEDLLLAGVASVDDLVARVNHARRRLGEPPVTQGDFPTKRSLFERMVYEMRDVEARADARGR